MNKIKVLLVEDENVLASIIKEALETRDFLITIAGNGVEGWALFHEIKPDLCVIDVMMPRKDGFSLVQDIRKIDSQIPLIFLTANFFLKRNYRKQLIPNNKIPGISTGFFYLSIVRLPAAKDKT